MTQDELELIPALSDTFLTYMMLGSDPELARAATAEFNRRHANDPKPAEPTHCPECFEGCPKCQP